MKRDAGLLVLVCFAAVVWWWPTTDYEFVYDDERFVVRNPAVTEGTPVIDYFTESSTLTGDRLAGGAYRPLRTLSWRILAKFDGDSPSPKTFHVANVLVFALSSGLLFGLMRSYRIPRWIALGAAFLFAVHPIVIEAVAWVSSFGDILALFFTLAAMLVLRAGPGRWRPAAVIALASLAFFAKESALPLVVILPLMSLAQGRGQIRKDLVLWVGLAVSAVVYLALRSTALADAGRGQVEEWTTSPLYEMGRGILYYTDVLVLRRPPAFDLYWPPTESLFPIVGWLAIVVVGVVAGVAALRAFKESRSASLIALCALGALAFLLPVAQFIPLNIIVADRFFLLPFVMVTFTLAAAFRNAPRSGSIVVALLACLAGYAALDARSPWKSDEMLWRRVLERHDQDPKEAKLNSANRARYNYGRALLARSTNDPATAAKARLEIAQGAHLVFGGEALLVKSALLAHDGLGTLFSGRRIITSWAQGDQAAAANIPSVLEMMDRALLVPLGRETRESWGARGLSALGRDPDVKTDPVVGREILFRLWRLRARLHRRAGQNERAIEAYGRVLSTLKVADLASLVERARLYAERGDADGRRRAAHHYQTALNLNPPASMRESIQKELASLGGEGR